jgi:hypothetical protein
MTLIDDWQLAWKKLSVWAFALIGAAPDIYSGVQSLGWLEDKAVPPAFVWTIRILAGVGIAVRLVKQQAKQGA